MADLRVRLTSPDKQLWPGVSKADLDGYYDAVAEPLLAHLADRPLTLRRHPDGIHASGFLQKNLPTSAPAWLRRHEEPSPSAGRTVSYLVVTDRDGLRWLAQMAAVEIHMMTVRVDGSGGAAADDAHDHRPDRMIVDLDPDADDPDPGPAVTSAARAVAAVMDDVGLAAAPMATGKRGLHLVAPIERRYSHDEVRGITLALCRAVAARDPERLTVEMRTADRSGRLLLDWSRSGSAQTVIAPWSPRAVEDAAVALPLAWDEVEAGAALPRRTMREAAQEVGDRAGWPEVAPQRLERVVDALQSMGFEPEVRSPRSRGHTDPRG